MPFDGTEVKSEVAIIDKMIDMLKDPKDWCQFTYQRDKSVCLMGALRIIDGQNPEPSFDTMKLNQLETINVENKIGELIHKIRNKKYYFAHASICDFNNSSTHSEIMGLLKKTREAFA